MPSNINYDDDYSTSYREQLSTAYLESTELGFTRVPLTSEKSDIKNNVLEMTQKVVRELSPRLQIFAGDYWGNSCQTLSTHIFACLNNLGIAADIVLGNVIIQDNDEFETTLESLQKEYRSTVFLTGNQAIHAWVTLGDDTIIDAALPPRMFKYYKAPPYFNDLIFIGRASEFSIKYGVRYQPLLVGSEFFAKTNPPDPITLMNDLYGR